MLCVCVCVMLSAVHHVLSIVLDTVHITDDGGSLQPADHTVSGSSIGSRHSGDSGLLSGQTSSTDVLERLSSTQLAQSSGFQSPTSELSTDEDHETVSTHNMNSQQCLTLLITVLYIL